jgi:hypothetical protein
MIAFTQAMVVYDGLYGNNRPSHLYFIDGALLSCLWHLYWSLWVSEAASGFPDEEPLTKQGLGSRKSEVQYKWLRGAHNGKNVSPIDNKHLICHLA